MAFGGLGGALMQTLVIPIQGDLPELLGTSRANASWVVTVSLLAGAIAMPLAGRLSDLYGRREVLAGSAALMAAGSVVCALGDSLTPILVGRALQGIAMGYIPVAISLVRDIMPPRQVPTAISVISATMGVGGALALPLSAWIAQEHDWHALFWMSSAVAVLIVVSTLVVVPSTPPADDASLDLVGAAGLALGLGGLLVGVSKGNEWGWAAPVTLTCLVGGTLVLLLWGAHQLTHRSPLVDLRANSRRPVLMTNFAALLVGFGMMASSIAVPQLMIMPTGTGHGLGLSLLEAGLWMTPGGLMMLFLAPVSARLIGGIGARLTLAIGSALLSCGYAFAALFMATPWQLALAMCLSSSGVAIAYAAMPTLILTHVPLEGAGAAVGLNGLMRSVGTTCAGAVIAAVLASSTVDFAGLTVPSADVFVLCFVIGAVATLLGTAVTLGIPKREPAPSTGARTHARASGAALDALEH
jgi:MFS family permease